MKNFKISPYAKPQVYLNQTFKGVSEGILQNKSHFADHDTFS